MKSLISALLIALALTISIHAQREATYALLGPVKSVITETADVSVIDGRNVEAPRVLSMTVLFNEDGSRPELGLYDAKGKLIRRIEMKYENWVRPETEVINYDGAGKMWLRIVKDRDSAGRHIGETTYGGDGSLVWKTILTRNEAGQVTENTQRNAKGVTIGKHTMTYNDAGEIESYERHVNRADGSRELKETYSRSNKRTETFTYDLNGALVVGKSIRIDREIKEYGPDGTLKKRIFITDASRLPEITFFEPDGSTRKEFQIPDEIDSYGNWTKQTKWVTDSKGTRPVKVTYRTLAYFVIL